MKSIDSEKQFINLERKKKWRGKGKQQVWKENQFIWKGNEMVLEKK